MRTETAMLAVPFVRGATNAHRPGQRQTRPFIGKQSGVKP